MATQVVILTNGKRVPAELVTTIMLKLESLLSDPIALYEAREVAKNPQHQFYAGYDKVLDGICLFAGGPAPFQLDDDVREIVQCVIVGDGLSFNLVHPVQRVEGAN